MKQVEKMEALQALEESATAYVTHHDGTVMACLTQERGAASLLGQIEVVTKELAGSNAQHFEIKDLKGRALIQPSRSGGRLLSLLNNPCQDLIKEIYPLHQYNPYVRVYFKLLDEPDLRKRIREMQFLGSWDLIALNNRLNGCVKRIQDEINSPSFKAEIKSHSRSFRENCKELLAYIDAIFRLYARVMVLRIDLAYAQPDIWPRNVQPVVDYEEVRRHREELLYILQRKKFKDSWLGYAWKLEYGIEKQFHYHFLIFLDGTKLRKDVAIGRIIGECWKEVTKGAGQYRNNNAFKSDYKDLGIGVINRSDTHSIDNLKNKVATYLTKVDYFVKLAMPNGGRAFGKGMLPKLKRTIRKKDALANKAPQQNA